MALFTPSAPEINQLRTRGVVAFRPGGVKIGSLDVFRAEAHADDARGDAAETWPAAQEFEGPGQSELLIAGENSADHVILHGDLQTLRGAGREVSALLDLSEFAF